MNDGAVERSSTPSPINGLSRGAGETGALSANGNFQPRPHRIRPSSGAIKARMHARARAWWVANVGNKQIESEQIAARLRELA